MKYEATAKYIRISTRKVRLVADAIRLMSPHQAVIALSASVKSGAQALADAISSALASAKQRGVDEHTLSFDSIEIMGGPVMKRWHAVARGMGHGYKKRMTHIRIILTDSGKGRGKKIIVQETKKNSDTGIYRPTTSTAVQKGKRSKQT